MADTVMGPDEIGWEQSEQLDQVQREDSLEDRGVDDVLDEGYSPVEKYRGEGWGTTADEAQQGETWSHRLAQEEPDITLDDLDLDRVDEDDLPREVGHRRAGRLVDPDRGMGEDHDAELVGSDIGIDGGAACAEEAAVHIIEPDDEE